MNTEKKVNILKEMRKLIETNQATCLYGAYAQVHESPDIENPLEALGIDKPANAGSPYWFNSFDKEPRLKLIDEALAKCETTFNVGDRVRILVDTYGNKGQVGTVESINTQDSIRVTNLAGGFYTVYVRAGQLELITEADPIKEAEQRVKDAQAELERLKNTPKDVKGLYRGQEMYWYDAEDENYPVVIDSQPFYSPEAYLSKERAEKELLRIRLAFIADSLNGGLFECVDDKAVYQISYSQNTNNVDVSSWAYRHGAIYFKTRELAEQAMTYFTKDELIKMLS